MSNDIIIELRIKGHEYKFLANTILRLRDTLRKLKINELLKQDLIKDTNIIQSILSKSEVKPQPVVQEKSESKKEVQNADKH